MEVSSHSLFLLQQLNIQREFGFLCDCTVAIGNVYFKAHRAVLAAFSNYFKMIFIHQSSECIKIQPTDIQPDIFSYLLHIMYTGMGPKQQVDQSRLQEGIKFLHAYRLYRSGAENGQEAHAAKMSNLYGIQISQSAAKDGLGLKEARSQGVEGDPASGRAERCQVQRSLAVGSEGTSSDRRRPPNPHDDTEASDLSLKVKKERVEMEVSGKPRTTSPVTESRSPGLVKDGPQALYCQYCGERCGSRQGLREHLFAHATSSLPFAVPAAILGSGDPEEAAKVREELEGLGQGQPLQSCGAEKSPGRPEQLEEALRQSRVLSEELAEELKGRVSPGARRRKIACAICSLKFAQKSQLQEHMYTHTGKHSRYHRYNRFCSQLIQASQHFCESQPEFTAEDTGRDTQDNVSSCYSLDSEISQESIDTVVVE
ncbi:zinc finger and BTB domain-containing protein 25-like [Conger conger]|uniref:zinc finger and BTB domain-containing protein 25-like n=1 Tax=Conger conger TaxID=82655 RepID=UPI002A5A9906|nr:zinc finger and BTB domain-containing protein 25-like [Conger conger]